MAKPLQDGDVVSGVSGTSAWRAGQPAPTMNQNPQVVHDDGGSENEVRELDVDSYGDCYDPTSPMRVRNSPWTMDTDHDGQKN